MGITKVGTKEVEGFGEDLDTAEYHDAAEELTRRDESDNTVEPQRLSDFQGGYGSSSLKECIELLNTTSRIAPAPLDSGIGQNAAVPSHNYNEKNIGIKKFNVSMNNLSQKKRNDSSSETSVDN